MVADDRIAEMWEEGCFDDCRSIEQVDAMQRALFDRTKAHTISVAHRLVWGLMVWGLNLEYLSGKID